MTDSTSWISIEGGAYRIGAQSERCDGPGFDPAAFEREGPPHEVSLAPFRIGRGPVTVGTYSEFIEAGGYDEPQWWSAGGWKDTVVPEGWAEQRSLGELPVVGVSWFEAMALAAFHGASLPTEAQWEATARGVQGRRFPWGDAEPEPSRLNCLESGLGGPTPVGAYPLGATPEGVLDLAGNVWEWCRDGFGDYRTAARPGDGARALDEDVPRVFRGGCFAARGIFSRAAMRAYGGPHQRFARRGFRIVAPV